MLGSCGVRPGYRGSEEGREGEGELVKVGTFSFKSEVDCTSRRLRGNLPRHEPQSRRAK